MARNNDNNSTNDIATELNTAQRRELVANLVRMGWSARAIGREMGVHHSTIVRDVKALREQLYKDAADQFRGYIGIQMDRLNALLNTHWGDAQAGNHTATQDVLDIMREQNALYGIPHQFNIPIIEERAQREAAMGEVDTIQDFLAKAEERQRQLAEVIYAFEGPAGYIEDGEHDVIEIEAE